VTKVLSYKTRAFVQQPLSLPPVGYTLWRSNSGLTEFVENSFGPAKTPDATFNALCLNEFT